VCIFLCWSACVSLCASVHVSVSVTACLFVHLRVCVRVVYVCECVSCVGMRLCMYVCMCVCELCVCACVCWVREANASNNRLPCPKTTYYCMHYISGRWASTRKHTRDFLLVASPSTSGMAYPPSSKLTKSLRASESRDSVVTVPVTTYGTS